VLTLSGFCYFCAYCGYGGLHSLPSCANCTRTLYLLPASRLASRENTFWAKYHIFSSQTRQRACWVIVLFITSLGIQLLITWDKNINRVQGGVQGTYKKWACLGSMCLCDVYGCRIALEALWVFVVMSRTVHQLLTLYSKAYFIQNKSDYLKKFIQKSPKKIYNFGINIYYWGQVFYSYSLHACLIKMLFLSFSTDF
jgi:hypothetical protein